MEYIHQIPAWPQFMWSDEPLVARLADVRNKQGRLLGKLSALGFEYRNEATLGTLTSDTVKSSAIEGEILDAREVRSSIARRLGLDVGGLPEPRRHVEGIVEVMLDATQNYLRPLSAERLWAWHAALFPTGRSGLRRIRVGGWRSAESGAMQVVSGPFGNERVHFEAPDADRLDDEMSRFMAWFNAAPSIDPVLIAAIAHFWFVTIHPFQDGNGRIARAIADMALARADGTPERYYSMSSQIESERAEYYLQLETAQRGDVDITRWLTWFVECLGRAIANAGAGLAHVLYKARLWQKANTGPVNDRQRQVINRLLGDFVGFLSTSKYGKLAKCSADTALRDIRELLDRGILIQNVSRGRSTSYRLAGMDEIPE